MRRPLALACTLLLAAAPGCMVPHWGAEPSAYLPATPPPPPEPHSRVDLAGDRGYVYQLGQDLWHVAPGQVPARVLTLPEAASLVLVDPALRFALLHEREWPAAEPAGRSRLVVQAIGRADRHVIVEPFYDFDVTALLAPDGKTLYVRAPLTRAAGRAAASHLLADLGDAGAVAHPWLPDDAGLRPIGWAPEGRRMAFWREVPAEVRTKEDRRSEVLVASPEDLSPRALAQVPGPGTAAAWLADGERLVTAWSLRKYEGVLHAATIHVADGRVEEAAFDVTDGQGADVAHVEPIAASPDGRKWLAARTPYASGDARAIVVDVASGRWTDAGALGPAMRWTDQGALECRQGEDAPWGACQPSASASATMVPAGPRK